MKKVRINKPNGVYTVEARFIAEHRASQYEKENSMEWIEDFDVIKT